MHAQNVRQYSFSHLTTRDGLSSNRVQSVVQDDKGFLWIATMNGLQRYDGRWFISFKHDPKDAGSISDNEIWHVFIDKKGRLWLIFGDGRIGTFDRSKFRFREATVVVDNPRVKTSFKHIYEDSKGNLMYIFEGLELITYDEQTNTFSKKYNVLTHPEGWYVKQVFEDVESGKYWLSSHFGLSTYNSKTKKLSYKEHNVENDPIIKMYGDLTNVFMPFVDSKRRFWFMTWVNTAAPSFYCYDQRRQLPLVHKQDMNAVMKGYCEPRDITEQKDGTIIVTGTPMLAEFNEAQQAFFSIQRSPFATNAEEFYHVLDSYIDREENIWLCTRNDGLYKFNPTAQLFNTIPHTNPITGQPGVSGVLSFIQCKDGTLLTSAWGEGVMRYDSNMNPIPLNVQGWEEKNTTTAWCMYRKSDGMIWMGLQKEGGNLMLYDEDKRKAVQYKVFERQTVRQLIEDRQGKMWVGMHSKGLWKWTPEKATAKFEDGLERFTEIPNCLVQNLMLDSSGHLWVATLSEGVYRINTATGEILEHLTDNKEPKLKVNGSGPVLQYNDSLFLIASGGLGIFNIKTKKIQLFTTNEGLPSAYVVSMMKDDRGFVWMGMLTGICRFDVNKKKFTYYDREDGMTNDLFALSAAYKLRDGRYVFGTNRDFIIFHPNAISGAAVPDVRISDFRLYDKSLSVDSLSKLNKVHLGHSNNSITIDFSALTYLDKNKLIYHYMLEGVDKDWKKSSSLPRAIYSYLAPGEYTFRVKAENTEGAFSSKATELKIRVHAPFWETWWFYSLLGLASAILLFWFDRERTKRKEAIQKMRSNIAGNLHQDINTALNNINILSEMAKLKADKEPAKSKEFIEQIHSKSYNMILAMDDMLWSINPDNDSIEKTMLRLKEFIDGLNNRYDVNIEMFIDPKVNDLKVSMQFRHEAFILFKETIRALVQSHATDCKIHVGIDKSALLYTVEFGNLDCDVPQFRHFLQRQDIEKRLSFLKATTDVHVGKDICVFELVLPFKNTNPNGL